ncbi:MAG: hypothetical protein KGI70_01035 [Patescibacteria group bacterium]|nr:hypothetical protein [Patescibacteria group bacterium]
MHPAHSSRNLLVLFFVMVVLLAAAMWLGQGSPATLTLSPTYNQSTAANMATGTAPSTAQH